MLKKEGTLPKTRSQAKALGEINYYTGRTCVNGHLSPRITSNGRCKACHAEQRVEKYQALSPEERRKEGEYTYGIRLAGYRNAPWKALLAPAKHRAKVLGLPFDLDEAYLASIWPADGRCPILGVELTTGRRADKGVWNSPSLDRIKPGCGYVRGNVAIMSTKANIIKSDVTDPEVFRRLADWMESQLVRLRNANSEKDTQALHGRKAA